MTSQAKPIEISDLNQFHEWVRAFAKTLQGNEVLLLSGEMGAGKTEFAKTLGEAWGAKGVASPTFALHARYSGARGLFDHFDLYRIENADELETTGLWEVLEESSLVLIEWPERVPASAWPRRRKTLRIRIEKTGSTTRRLILEN